MAQITFKLILTISIAFLGIASFVDCGSKGKGGSIVMNHHGIVMTGTKGKPTIVIGNEGGHGHEHKEHEHHEVAATKQISHTKTQESAPQASVKTPPRQPIRQRIPQFVKMITGRVGTKTNSQQDYQARSSKKLPVWIPTFTNYSKNYSGVRRIDSPNRPQVFYAPKTKWILQ